MRDIEILMLDGCTKADAKRHLEKGSIVFSDLEEHFGEYMEEWGVDEEEQAEYKAMITNKEPMVDWGVVEVGEQIYYIMYAL